MFIYVHLLKIYWQIDSTPAVEPSLNCQSVSASDTFFHKIAIITWNCQLKYLGSFRNVADIVFKPIDKSRLLCTYFVKCEGRMKNYSIYAL